MIYNNGKLDLLWNQINKESIGSPIFNEWKLFLLGEYGQETMVLPGWTSAFVYD